MANTGQVDHHSQHGVDRLHECKTFAWRVPISLHVHPLLERQNGMQKHKTMFESVTLHFYILFRPPKWSPSRPFLLIRQREEGQGKG